MGRGDSRLVPEKTAGALPFIRKAAGGFFMRLTDPRFKSAAGIGALRTVYPSPVKPSPVRRSPVKPSPVREIRFFKRLPGREDSILPESSGYQGFDLSSRSYAGAFPSAKTSPGEKDSDPTERSEGGIQKEGKSRRRGNSKGRKIQKEGRFGCCLEPPMPSSYLPPSFL